MLRIAPKGGIAHTEYLTLEQDRIMRSAFGRYSGPAADREAAVALVRHYQQLGHGFWFLCDCRPDMPRPPALVPVIQTHIRRHQDERWPVHWPCCDFERDPGEQREITASYARPSPEKPMRLVRTYGVASDSDKPVPTRHSQHDRRPSLARLLMHLVSTAGLQRIEPGWRPPSLVDQVKALWAASRTVEIDAGVKLPSYFCTSRPSLTELKAKIADARPGGLTRSRPHGVLVTRVAQLDSRTLIPVSGPPIPVRSRLAMFGEEAGSASVQQAEGTVRTPYLAACVVGRAAPEEPVEVLSAYVHPIAGAQHLMLVDSDLERHTLAQVRSVQTWLGDRKQVAVTIEKPVFDVGADRAPSTWRRLVGADRARVAGRDDDTCSAQLCRPSVPG